MAVASEPTRRRRTRHSTPPVQVSVAPRTLIVFVLLAAGAVAVAALAMALQTVIVELVVAVVLAMALEPLVQAFERRRLGRGAAVGLSFGIVTVALVVFAYLLFRPLVSELERFAHDLPRLTRELTHGQGGSASSRRGTTSSSACAPPSRVTAQRGPPGRPWGWSRAPSPPPAGSSSSRS